MNALYLLFLMFAPQQAATPPVTFTPTNWYIRADGGNQKQCNGLADAPYVAGGSNACALNDYRLLAFPGNPGYALHGTWIISGGDIVHIAAGQYRVGCNGPNAVDHNGLCSAGNPFTSALPPIPSGTADHPTQIIGAGSAVTQLYGGYGAGDVIDLSTSSYVTISGLELTDHEQCTRIGAGYAAPVVGCSSSYPLSDYAGNGIVTGVATHDIKLTDLNIHGFTSRGIIGPIGGLVTVDHVRIAFNGMAGWDFDDGKGTKSSENALLDASYLTIEGSGCNEEYPIVHPLFPASSCFDQSSGGYGDAIGTPNTPLSISCDHCTFRYNTQDGLDGLHSSDSSIKVTNSQSYGNMGQQWKLGAMASVIFRNNTTVHNCSRMSAPIGGNSTYNKYLSNFCRAAGDGFGINVKDGGTYVYQNNSYAGYGSTTYDIGCAGSEANIVFQNNLHVGYKNPAGGQYPGIFYYEAGCPANPFKARDHNIYFRMRTAPADGASTDPHIADEPAWTDETSLDAVDFHLTAQSANAIGQGVAIDGLTTDLEGTKRISPPSIGAFDFGSGGAPPSDGGGTAAPPDNGGTTAPPDTGGSTAPPDNGGTSTPPDDGGGQAAPPVTTPTPVIVGNTIWTKVATEGETVTLPPFTTYRYGAGSSWSDTLTTGSSAATVTANNATFTDVDPNVIKELDAQVQVSQPPIIKMPVEFTCTTRISTTTQQATATCTDQ